MIPVRLKYFEEGPSWTERRPSSAAEATGTSTGGTAPASLAKAFSVSTIDLSGGISSVGEMESFNNALAASSPSFVFVHNATLVARQQMMQSSYVRKMYGITELVRYEPREGAEKGSLALVRVGVVCESADSAVKLLDSSLGGGGCVRFFMMLQVRSFAGASMTVSAVYIDPAAMLWQRVAVLTHLFPQLVNADLVLLVSNLFLSQTGALSLETSAELHAVCTAKGFSDAAEESVEKNSGGHGGVGQQEWSVWVKSSKFAATHLTHEALLSAAAGAKASAGITTVTLSCRGAAAITIPQPRSAKSANSRGSPASTATPAIMTDPAILSAEAAGKGITTAAKGGGSVIIERLLQQQQQQQQQQQAVPRWRTSHSYTLKNNEKLNSHELAFDVSAHFASVPEVVEALNNRSIYWPAEYCVAHNVILASDNVGPGDKRVMLRRYAREYKNSAALLSQMFSHAGSIHCSPNTGANVHSASQEVATEKSPWLKRVVAMSNHTKNESNGEDTPSLPSTSRVVKREEELRSRIWDASWCTVIYQVTPREMKFNITSVVGIGKDNLNEAIQWLNLRSQPKAKAPHGKENPLQNYAYDYALLFSTEHQGYYLIAATHVPCDIVACRAAA
ncbi:hypothetical protein C3747_169g46 [Trypanosoma cruzi]|uniref:Uncharacterized protein n=2 Tax=Trypanosoma cruzi TaxID=5693 RepID=Q4D195_TRYCC|nr:hypothetical protein, conserved [Trypanosoma cruzi]EAN86292.1 hypothetical protein, conserved [Trypanosoma cruzi]KAF8277133.1 hypothetical protein TcYC6_0016030 [Trypanosoma cruzi]PWV03799.1 hypothetical protein C3747_169g46 [Trypanosoma cruzi]RNC58284.1 hypothetical protein TcCL_ESM04091 [Trypanosoma cruzi]|eukprot:XP_808143.1 hypothetical protein [Trypanosoma cruzi strain CL Brener]